MLFTGLLAALAVPMAHLVLLLIARIVLRRQWLAFAAYALILGILVSLQFSLLAGSGTAIVTGLVFGVTNAAIILFVLQRFGLLALVGTIVTAHLLGNFPLTTDFSAPFLPAAFFGVVLAFALAAYGFHLATTGQKLFSDTILDD
jgi:hypothetical protein